MEDCQKWSFSTNRRGGAVMSGVQEGEDGGDILCCNPRSFVGEPLRTHWAVYWVVSRAGLNIVLKRRTSICEANQTCISRPSGSEPTYFTDCARRSTNVENTSVTLPSHFVLVLWDREGEDLRNRVGTMRDAWEGVELCAVRTESVKIIPGTLETIISLWLITEANKATLIWNSFLYPTRRSIGQAISRQPLIA